MKTHQHPASSKQWLAYLSIGMVVAFMPALLRRMGIKGFLSTTSNQDSIVTYLLCLIGASLIAYAVYLTTPNKHDSARTIIIATVFIATYFLAFYTNVFSLFAF